MTMSVEISSDIEPIFFLSLHKTLIKNIQIIIHTHTQRPAEMKEEK